MTQNEIIKNLLFNARESGDGWVLGGTIRSKETEWGFVGFRGDRDARNLYKRKEIFAKMMPKEPGGKEFVWYRYKHDWEEWRDKDSWKTPNINLALKF